LQINNIDNPHDLYTTLMDIIVRLAEHGLIHGDFNEFNIILSDDQKTATFIDFPQMVCHIHLLCYVLSV
jgi:RIO kinase 2